MHAGKEATFVMKVDKSHRSPLTRQVEEAVSIEIRKLDNLMNSKTEYNGSRIPRIRIEVGNKLIEGEDGSLPWAECVKSKIVTAQINPIFSKKEKATTIKVVEEESSVKVKEWEEGWRPTVNLKKRKRSMEIEEEEETESKRSKSASCNVRSKEKEQEESKMVETPKESKESVNEKVTTAEMQDWWKENIHNRRKPMKVNAKENTSKNFKTKSMKKILKHENAGNISKRGKINKKTSQAQTQKITSFFKNVPNSNNVGEVELEKVGVGVEHSKRIHAINSRLRKLPELSTFNLSGTNYDGGGGGGGEGGGQL